MKTFTRSQKITSAKIYKLIIASLAVGLLSGLLGISLKRITEHYQHLLFTKAENNNLYFLIFPIVGLSLIYLLRQYLFKKKQNKGIKEVFESTEKGTKLPSYKIPSHFINGLLTVSFGGSTGIEVSTVVSTAAIGSLAQEKEPILKRYKKELICAGITGGITALFCSPLAGLLFAYEVVLKKVSKSFLLTNILAALVSYAFILVLDDKPLFAINITDWHIYAIPYFLLLGIIAGMHSVYLTKCVLFFKKQFSRIQNNYHKIIAGAAVISAAIIIFPELFGDGYHAIRDNINHANTLLLTIPLAVTFICILFLKPVITSITLSAGGDGGVFAPSLFIGAFLGLLVAVSLNTFFDAGVIPLNFVVIGMAAMLSASIHAPFTALFLICGLVNDYTLFLPVLIASLAAKYTAKSIYPYTVYSLTPNKA
jgi:CIC family chloride channel protein